MSLPIASRTRCIFERYPWISADCTSARLGMSRSAGFNTAANDLTARPCDKCEVFICMVHCPLPSWCISGHLATLLLISYVSARCGSEGDSLWNVVDGGNIHSQSLILKYPYLEWCKSRCTLDVYVVYTEKYHV